MWGISPTFLMEISMFEWPNEHRDPQHYDENNTLLSIVMEKVTFLAAVGITLLLIIMTFFWA